MYQYSIINMQDNMNPHRQKILKHIEKSKVVTSSEIAQLLKISWNTADSYLKDLVIEGKIIRIKKDGVNLWLIK
mgnify:CR=1 FL=1